MLHEQIISNACTCTLEIQLVMFRFLFIVVHPVIRHTCTPENALVMPRFHLFLFSLQSIHLQLLHAFKYPPENDYPIICFAEQWNK